MATTKNTSPNKWTEDSVEPPFRGTHTEDAPGTFRIRDKDRPTLESGWDVVGSWDVSEGEGIVILRVELAPSQYVFDSKSTVPRRRTEEEMIWSGRVKFQDIGRIRLKLIRDTIRERASDYLDDPFFDVPDDMPSDAIVRRQVDLVRSAADSRSAAGRPRTSDVELDQWARDVWRILSDGPTESLYDDLMYEWDVSESTIKNVRLPLLRKTGRLEGKGWEMTPGRNYPKEDNTDG